MDTFFPLLTLLQKSVWMELKSFLKAIGLKQIGVFSTPTLSLLGFLLTLINHHRSLEEFSDVYSAFTSPFEIDTLKNHQKLSVKTFEVI